MAEQTDATQSSEPSSIGETLAWVEEPGSDGWARVRMPIRQRHRNAPTPTGAVQGGVVISLADRALVNASNSVLAKGYTTATIELKANLIAAVSEGELIAECRLIHRGRRLHVGDIEVRDGTGRLIAKVSGTNLVIEPREAEQRA